LHASKTALKLEKTKWKMDSILYGRLSLQRTCIIQIDTIQEIGDAQAADGAMTSHGKNCGKKL
jgi:hypothetical protein